MFKDDDYLPDEISYEPLTHVIHSSLINTCVTITEENEEELEQLRLDDEKERHKKYNHLLKMNDGSIPTAILHDNDDRADILENENDTPLINTNDVENVRNDNERLSTIYESASPPLPSEEEEEEDIYDDAYDKLIVYDIVNEESMETVILYPSYKQKYSWMFYF